MAFAPPDSVIPVAPQPETTLQSELDFNAIANATPVMIWLAGTDGLCHWFNTGWLQFTGRTMAQEQGNGWAEGVHPDDLTRCLSHYQSHFDRRLPFQMEYRLRHHSGQHRWIVDNGIPRFDAQKNFVGYIGTCVDVDELRHVKDQLAGLAEAVPGVVYQYLTRPDGSGQLEYVSRGIETLFGLRADQVTSDIDALMQRIYPDDREPYRRSVSESARTHHPWAHQFRIQKPGEPVTWVLGQAAIHQLGNGSLRWSGLFTDITQQKALEMQLRLSASVFDAVQEAIIITDAHANIINVNEGFCRQSGYRRDEVLGQNPRILKSGYQPSTYYDNMWSDLTLNGHWSGEVFNRHKSGLVYAVLLNVSVVRNDEGQVMHYVAVATDIDHLKAQQQLLERTAHFDALTGLPNRVLLTDRLRQTVTFAQRQQTTAGVCFLDLDGFKLINDQYGHATGDEVLKVVAQRLRDQLRSSDTAARLGGDEFVLLLEDVESASALEHVLSRLLESLQQPIDLPQGQKGCISASIGVSLYPDHAIEPDTLLRLADQAMYTAKNSGKNRYRFHSKETSS